MRASERSRRASSAAAATPATVTAIRRASLVLEVNGIAAFRHRTHQSTAYGVLREMGVVVAPEDRLLAPSISELRQGAHIALNAARTVLVLHDNVLESVTGMYFVVLDSFHSLFTQ